MKSLVVVVCFLTICGCGKTETRSPQTPASTTQSAKPNQNSENTKVEPKGDPKESVPTTDPDFVELNSPSAYVDPKPTSLGSVWNVVPASLDPYLGSLGVLSVEAQVKTLNDPMTENYLNHLGQELVSHARGHSYPFSFKVLDTGDINAFALPGGRVYVNRGLIENVKNEDVLAGVLGHEISHVTLRHSTRIQTMRYGVAAVILVASLVASGRSRNRSAGQDAVFWLSLFGLDLLTLKYSRDLEREADIASTQMLNEERYNPLALSDFFNTQGRSGWQPWLNWLASHPPSADRVQAVQNEVDHLGGLKGRYRVDSPEFRAVKEHLLLRR